jgi:hypothetical protein
VHSNAVYWSCDRGVVLLLQQRNANRLSSLQLLAVTAKILHKEEIMRLLALVVLMFSATIMHAEEGFLPLFNGTNLDGWKVSENPTSVKVEEGCLIVHGARAHVFYAGEVAQHNFTNFHLRAEVMTAKNANSGIYFHTVYQESGWPGKGYEAQINNSHKDPKKTGGLYNVQDNFTAPVADDVWFVYEIIVEGKHIVVKIDGKVICDYTEPADLKRPERQLSSGTFAIQCHDPGSRVKFKSLAVKVLP